LALVQEAIPVTLPDDAPERWFEADRNALRRFTYLFPYYGIRDRDLLKVHRALGIQIAASFPAQPAKAPPRAGKLRVGFISYNFGNHPIGHLLSVFSKRMGHPIRSFIYIRCINNFRRLMWMAMVQGSMPPPISFAIAETCRIAIWRTLFETMICMC